MWTFSFLRGSFMVRHDDNFSRESSYCTWYFIEIRNLVDVRTKLVIVPIFILDSLCFDLWLRLPDALRKWRYGLIGDWLARRRVCYGLHGTQYPSIAKVHKESRPFLIAVISSSSSSLLCWNSLPGKLGKLFRYCWRAAAKTKAPTRWQAESRLRHCRCRSQLDGCFAWTRKCDGQEHVGIVEDWKRIRLGKSSFITVHRENAQLVRERWGPPP